ncbi:MAG TPA: UbiA family prenyltransferase [Chloroflexia bacterium]|nr:UbiA family prenyltransferase [Chloroflexia bacterium]
MAPQKRGKAGVTDYWRLLHPVPSLLTVAAAGAFVLLASRGSIALDRLLHLLAIEGAMQFSISAFNDYFDRPYDAGRRDKPVASGTITPAIAATLGAIFGLSCLLLALPIGPWLLLLTAVGLTGGLIYDAGLKRTAFSWLPFSVAFPTLPLWAWAGVEGRFPPQLAWVVPVGGVMVLGIHLADTIPDLTGDTEAGVRGLAHRIGLQRSLALCWCAFGAAALMTLILSGVLQYRYEWYLPGLFTGTLLMAAGVAIYFLDRRRLKLMALLLELGALVLAVGWVAAVTL